MALPANAFKFADTSTTWQIQNVQVKCVLVSLDSVLNESYTKLLKGGKKLTLNYNTFISQYQTIIGQTDISIHITRSLTRLKSVFDSFWKRLRSRPKRLTYSSQNWNDCFSPAAPETINGVNTYNLDGEFQCQLQIGSKLYPECPMRSHQEAYYQLRKHIRASIVIDPQFVIKKDMHINQTHFESRLTQKRSLKQDVQV